MKPKILLLAPLLFAIFAGAANAGTITIKSLLDEMTDRDERARFPEPAFTCAQFSSYDRASVAPDKPGWFANSDRSMFLRVERNNGRREFVMFDAGGPGAIVRFWMTFAGKDCGRGTMRIYIDGDDAPAVEGAAFDILSGSIIAGPPLAASVSEETPYERRGHNLYFPIPYARHCKITYESERLSEDDPGAKKGGTERVYYNINYRSYPAGTPVESFSKSVVQRHAGAIANAQAQLASGAAGLTINIDGYITNLATSLEPGASRDVTLRGGPAAIDCIALHLGAENQEQALRSTILEIAFDGEQTVRVPIGDFFGIGYKQLRTNTYYTATEKSGFMRAAWIMPYEKTCTITLRNLGAQTVHMGTSVVIIKDWKWDARSMHFGAGWRQYTKVLAGPHDKAVDLNYAELRGKGVYVGDNLAIFNTTYRWWGEGDEKVYVDGEKFPSHIGTGTEDYYGYAWCRPEGFTGHPFIAQPLGEGNFAPKLSVNTRYRGLDAIPFDKSLRFDMELWHWSPTRVNYAPAAFWYMLPGGRSLAPDNTADAREPVALDRSDIIPSDLQGDKAGALFIEGEDLLVEKTTSGKAAAQSIKRPMPWSGGAQLWWRDLKPEARATFAFYSDVSGRFDMTAFLTTANDYGTFDVRLNGKIVFKNLNLNTPELYTTTAQAGVELVKGKNTLEVELVAPSKHPGGKTHFGLDRLLFK
ncbi:glycoside hydrolase family 172 protein [Ereboglobus sp. PH5-10]|uniref:glycoside hydrolase family 172 protein n=1 Tax=Ereboglobus sp. PH5-10 TaxID=2940629 RepID=UPI0024053C69|nr:glycoside hydrolase family 172 protein [Ereboglobus sp. PH5-10]